LKKKSEVEAIAAEFQKYDSGELEPPLNTQGALRQLYNKARRLEHCVEQLEIDLDVNAVFNLLFYQGVKENFASYYKDDLQEAEDIFKDLNPASLTEAMGLSIKNSEAALDWLKKDLEKTEKNPEDFIAEVQKNADNSKVELDKLLNDPAYAHLKGLVSTDGQYTGPVLDPPKEDQEKLSKLMEAISNHRYLSQSAKYIKENIETVINEKKESVKFAEESLVKQRLSHQSIKDSLAKDGIPVWIPSKENLSKKTRKEMLQNIHNMNSLLSADALSDKQKKVVKWLNTVQANHLQYFQNPFSWHEYTGQVEAPFYSVRLTNFTNPGNGMMYGGMSGFMTVPNMGLQFSTDQGGFNYQGRGFTGGFGGGL